MANAFFKNKYPQKFGTIFHRVVMSSDKATQCVMSIKAVAYFASSFFGYLPSGRPPNTNDRG